jgi:hypothetical protein
MYFFSIAEVLLEENVDPGWVHHSLIPTLERGGMRGGGWYHNSVKTTIFNNSVNSLGARKVQIFTIIWLWPRVMTSAWTCFYISNNERVSQREGTHVPLAQKSLSAPLLESSQAGKE